MARVTQPRALRRVLTVLVLTGLAGLTIVALAAGPASAHAKLLGSAPGDGATVTDPLPAVVLEFNEPVGAPELAVTGPDGQPLAVGPAEAQNHRVVQPLPSLTQQGAYSVTYRVISADKDPVGGQLAFTYHGPVPQARPTATGADTGGEGDAAGEAGRQGAAAAEPASSAGASWPILAAAVVAVLGVIGAAWYAFTRKGQAGS